MSFWEKLFGQRRQAASGSPAPSRQSESATFVQECAKTVYMEQAESRTGGDPAFRHVPDALNARRYAEAGQMAQKVISDHPDLDLGYCWAASAYSGTQKYEEARSILTEGLRRAKRKCNLCIRLGNAERDLGNIQGAVYWWTQAVHCQQSIRTGDEYDPYLYLAYVADALGLNDVAGSLFSRVDRMRPGTVRLSPAAEDTLRARVKDGDSTSMTSVLRSLHKQYFLQDFVTVEKATPPTASTAPAELNRTLKQLEVKLQQKGGPGLPIISLRVGEASGQTVIRWHYVNGYGATSVLLDADAATQWLTKELSPFGVKIVKRGFTDGSRERGSPERCFVWSVEMQKSTNP
jgi:tetratricopeptide (TPR) repeat protein